jgi:hypothetical protein
VFEYSVQKINQSKENENMKKKILGITFATIFALNGACFASGEMPDEFKLGEKVNLNRIEALSKDAQATAFINAGSIYRCNTRDGMVMQIDHMRIDETYYGVTICGAATQVPTGGKLLSQSQWNGMLYMTYQIADGSIVRVNSRNGVVQSVSHIMNNI